ncbi:MAG: tetraacyldisaccharide 4'-kinase [Chitinispirillaceae bacterium]|nr:tetraacyldisaccharide 4'-kinase [Chitinispirillaceae bacterium]
MTDTHLRFDTPLPRWFAGTPAAAAASLLYGTAVHLRNRHYDHYPESAGKVSLPVISIGGIRAGGTGKTPAVMLLATILQQQGYEVGLLSRGYKRTDREPVIVAPGETVEWERTGDEPAMLRAACPGIWLGIGQDRTPNARFLCERMGNRAVLLLDDGFQHRKLHRDLDILCLHESLFIDRLLPQGYLREPVTALGRAQVFFLTGNRDREKQLLYVDEKLAHRFPEVPRFLLFNDVVAWVNARTGEETQKVPFSAPVAISGIARPERFFDLLARDGVQPCRKMVFTDHYHYTDYDIAALRKLYSQGLITTEKDAVRLSSLDDIPEDSLWYLKVRLQFSENSSFNRFNHYINAVLT